MFRPRPRPLETHEQGESASLRGGHGIGVQSSSADHGLLLVDGDRGLRTTDRHDEGRETRPELPSSLEKTGT